METYRKPIPEMAMDVDVPDGLMMMYAPDMGYAYPPMSTGAGDICMDTDPTWLMPT